MSNEENINNKKYIDFPDVNRVVVAGDILYDPPLRWTKRGVPVTNFVISTCPDPEIVEPEELRSRKCFISVVVWAQKAVFCHENLKKDVPVMIIGELQSMPNYTPEKGYYPVQVNAKWIQVLEKTKTRKQHIITDEYKSDEEFFVESAEVKGETSQYNKFSDVSNDINDTSLTTNQ